MDASGPQDRDVIRVDKIQVLPGRVERGHGDTALLQLSLPLCQRKHEVHRQTSALFDTLLNIHRRTRAQEDKKAGNYALSLRFSVDLVRDVRSINQQNYNTQCVLQGFQTHSDTLICRVAELSPRPQF